MRRALISILFMMSAFGFAQAQETMGFAQAVSLLERSCGQDIGRYCGQANLANFGINKCLEENASKLTAQCNADRVTVRQAIQARLDAQAAAPQICAGDAKRHCPTIVRGQGYTVQCLVKAERVVSKKCNAAITAAGWR